MPRIGVSRLRSLQQFPNTPDVIGDPSSHRGRTADALVNPAEIIEGVPARCSSPMVLPLLAERICEPGEAASSHPHAQIGPFDY